MERVRPAEGRTVGKLDRPPGGAGARVAAMALALIAGLGCGRRASTPSEGAVSHPREGKGMQIESKAFVSGGEIPARYTCEGENVSPPLTWTGVPASARSLVLIVDDPDAPDPAAPRTTWVHWVVYDIPPDRSGLLEGAGPVMAPARSALNDWRATAYGGPCPPIGRHRYFHKLYALDRELGDLGKNATKTDVEKAMAGHVVEKATLVGTYQKGG
jgi:Raf kinase inhibitor-like YbhB/YbcL family protein